jgi:hypothetical protein
VTVVYRCLLDKVAKAKRRRARTSFERIAKQSAPPSESQRRDGPLARFGAPARTAARRRVPWVRREEVRQGPISRPLFFFRELRWGVGLAQQLLVAEGMSEAYNLADDSTDQLDVTESVRLTGGPGADDDHLVITRLPPMPRPPPLGRIDSIRSVAPPHAGTVSAPSVPYGATAAPSFRPKEARTSWWRALLQSKTVAPLAGAGPSDGRGRIAAVSVILALVSATIAVFMGLRDVSPVTRLAPVLAASIVVAHALVAVGLIAFGAVLLGVGERLWTAELRGERNDSAR